jgi:4'-phosphopantetheinyl transferase
MGKGGEMERESGKLPPPTIADWHEHATVSSLLPGEIRVWVVELDAGFDPDDDQDSAEPYAEREILSSNEIGRADRFVRPRDRRRFIRCRAALRRILGQLISIRADSLRFRVTGNGKPELDWTAMESGDAIGIERCDLQFNVSHSAGIGLIAVGRTQALGVDVEQLRPIAEAERIVANYFTPSELTEFRALADEAKAQAFMRGWTRKEAILKGLGVGLAGLATHHETWFGIDDLARRFVPIKPHAGVGDWYLWEAAPRPGYVAALAIEAI